MDPAKASSREAIRYAEIDAVISTRPKGENARLRRKKKNGRFHAQFRLRERARAEVGVAARRQRAQA